MSEQVSRPVVVGVDGSAAARAALEWAVEDARRRGCRVDAVSAWHPDYGIIIGPTPAEVVTGLLPQEMRAAARTRLDEALQGVGGDVEIRPVLVEGDPRTALVEASKNAELLVVGNRGHGVLVEAVLGSVSSHCVHNASCPVVVIRAPKPETGEQQVPQTSAAPLTPGPLL
ncbi:Nucleotide-binding universal stress protein, UspA family [Lentzea fradiae]|uniref:Nucleotide-binding universal stress protein, UspA family n=1 Tax=Lentzea fradiae TaxID=200378 RepID=A0A1G8DPU7_9PSEU|nr:universal stress protein [Lentzea fradiae]SDH59499.1 Nucleotide-binding universal stress protein, UspA family [Lentzea fradiae]